MSAIITCSNQSLSEANSLKKEMVFKNGVIDIKAAGYNGTHMVKRRVHFLYISSNFIAFYSEQQFVGRYIHYVKPTAP